MSTVIAVSAAMAGRSPLEARSAPILEAAELMRLLANPNRLAILHRLMAGEASVGEMEKTLGIRQPTLSQQLGELRKAGIVADRRAAKAVIYHLADRRARAAIAHLFDPKPADPEPDGAPAASPPAAPNTAANLHAAVFARVLEPIRTERDAV